MVRVRFKFKTHHSSVLIQHSICTGPHLPPEVGKFSRESTILFNNCNRESYTIFSWFYFQKSCWEKLTTCSLKPATPFAFEKEIGHTNPNELSPFEEFVSLLESYTDCSKLSKEFNSPAWTLPSGFKSSDFEPQPFPSVLLWVTESFWTISMVSSDCCQFFQQSIWNFLHNPLFSPTFRVGAVLVFHLCSCPASCSPPVYLCSVQFVFSWPSLMFVEQIWYNFLEGNISFQQSPNTTCPLCCFSKIDSNMFLPIHKLFSKSS